MECNCNNNNNGGVIPWVRGNRLPLCICIYQMNVDQGTVSTMAYNTMTRTPYVIQADDTVTVTMKSGFRSVEMPFTTDGNKVLVIDNGELPTGTYTVEVTIERGSGERGRWQESRQVRIYENTDEAILGEMYSIEADLFFWAKGDTGNGIADITSNPDYTLTITMTDGTTYTTQTMKGDKGDKGDQGEKGTSIVSFDVTGQTETSVIYTVTFSDDTTEEVAVPKGPQGDTGLTGNGIASTTLNSDYTLTIAYTDGTTYTTSSIRGAQGVQGVSIIAFTQTGETSTNTLYNVVFSDGRTQSVAIPKGLKGDKGDTGNTGPQGIQGPKGDTVIIGDEQEYTLYNVTGQNTDGAMTQKAVTDNLVASSISYDNSIDYFPGDNVQDALDEVGDSTFVEGEAIDLGTKYECAILGIDRVWTASAAGATRTCRIISVNEGQKYKIYGRTTIREGQSEPDASVYAWLTTDSHVLGERADYVPGYEGNRTVPPYIGTIVTAPQGAKYMYVGHNINNVPRLPRQITPLLSAREGIETLNGSIYGKGYNNGANITIAYNDTAYMYSHSGWVSNQSTNCQFIPIENAVSFKITANAEQAVLYTFVTRIREEGDVVGALCPTDRNTHAVLAGETAFTTVIPEDAEYLYIGITDAYGRNHTPESIVVYTDKVEASDGNVEDIAEINSQLLIDADDPVYAVDDSLDIAKCLMRHGVVGDQFLRMLYGNDKSHHLLIPTGNASEFTIVGNAVNSTSLVWLSSDEYEYDKTVPLAPGEATKHSIPAGETIVLEVPAGTRFMVINVDSTENEDARPESITVTGIVSKFTPNKEWKTDKIDDNSSSIKALLGNYDAADGEINLNINELGKDGAVFVQWFLPKVLSTNYIHKRIYYTFCDEKGSTGVGCINAFDHRSWKTVLKRVLTTNNDERKPDMHNTAAIQMLPDRRLICFYTEGHSTTPYMLYRITKRPEDITEWEDVISVRVDATQINYAQYYFINGRHYVFTRVNSLGWGYIYSDDLVTWSDLNIFVTSDVQYYMLLMPIDGADKKLRFIMYSNPHYNDRAIRSGIIDFETGNVYDYDGVTLKGNISAPISKNDFTILVPDINTNYTQRMHDLAITDADTIRITYSRAYSRYGNGANKNKYFVYEWNRGDAASGSITDLGEAGEIVVGHSNTYNCSGAYFIDKDRLFVQKSSQDETGDDWTELWTRTNNVWSMTKELYREQKYCFDETDPSNNRIRNFYPNVDSNGKYVLWCRGKYGISDFYNAVSDVMVYDVEKDVVF